MQSKQLISCRGKVEEKAARGMTNLIARASKSISSNVELIKTLQHGERDAKAGPSLPHRFLCDCRANSATADRNKENIPSGSRIRARQDGAGGMEARECRGGRNECTPRPRKWRHSPTLVQLTGNRAAHAVSHRSFSHLLSSSRSCQEL